MAYLPTYTAALDASLTTQSGAVGSRSMLLRRTPVVRPMEKNLISAEWKPLEFKGVELFARFDKGKNQWLFGVIPGINPLKDADEVNQSMTINGLDALLAEMKQVAPREEVSLVPPNENGKDVTPLDEETLKKSPHSVLNTTSSSMVLETSWSNPTGRSSQRKPPPRGAS